MPRTRFGAAIYLMLVFASGILVGAVSHRLYVTSTVNANNNIPPKTMEQYRKQFFGEMRQKVGANEEQISKINQILDDTKRKFDELHAQEKPLRDKIDQERVDEIRDVLTEPQKIAYDNWRAERLKAQAEEQRRKQAQKKK